MNVEVTRHGIYKSFLSTKRSQQKHVLFIGRETNGWKIASNGDEISDERCFRKMKFAAENYSRNLDTIDQLTFDKSSLVVDGYCFSKDESRENPNLVAMNRAINFNAIAFGIAGIALGFDPQTACREIKNYAKMRESLPILFADLYALGSRTNYFDAPGKSKYYEMQMEDESEICIDVLCKKLRHDNLIGSIDLVIICGSSKNRHLARRAKLFVETFRNYNHTAVIVDDFPFLSARRGFKHALQISRFAEELRMRGPAYEKMSEILSAWNDSIPKNAASDSDIRNSPIATKTKRLIAKDMHYNIMALRDELENVKNSNQGYPSHGNNYALDFAGPSENNYQIRAENGLQFLQNLMDVIDSAAELHPVYNDGKLKLYHTSGKDYAKFRNLNDTITPKNILNCAIFCLASIGCRIKSVSATTAARAEPIDYNGILNRVAIV